MALTTPKSNEDMPYHRMTARRELRHRKRRLGRGQAPIDATPAPPVGETLQLARERKGVDLYRAERDTKIRLRYLAALEDSDYDDLPAPVYTKGFLRNYAIYLGLDPDELLDRWRDEMEAAAHRRACRRRTAAAADRRARGRRLTVTPGMFVAGLVRARHPRVRRLPRRPVAALRRGDAGALT